MQKDAISNKLSEVTIDELRNVLKTVEGVDSQSVDDFINNLYGFRDEATDEEALNSLVNTYLQLLICY